MKSFFYQPGAVTAICIYLAVFCSVIAAAILAYRSATHTKRDLRRRLGPRFERIAAELVKYAHSACMKLSDGEVEAYKDQIFTDPIGEARVWAQVSIQKRNISVLIEHAHRPFDHEKIIVAIMKAALVAHGCSVVAVRAAKAPHRSEFKQPIRPGA